jgi:hypothetical protein
MDCVLIEFRSCWFIRAPEIHLDEAVVVIETMLEWFKTSSERILNLVYELSRTSIYGPDLLQTKRNFFLYCTDPKTNLPRNALIRAYMRHVSYM